MNYMTSNATRKNENEIKVSVDISWLKKFIEDTILQSLEFYLKYNKNFIKAPDVVPENEELLTVNESCALLR